MIHPAWPTEDFFDQVRIALPAERPGDGTPSASDFLAAEMWHILSRFVEHWDELLPDWSDSSRRHLVSFGRFVHRYRVVGVLQDDGTVRLIYIEIEVHRASDGPTDVDDF